MTSLTDRLRARLIEDYCVPQELAEKLLAVVSAAEAYRRECGNPALDALYRRTLRLQLFEALAALEEEGNEKA